MSARMIWDHELKSIRNAAYTLFSGEGDARDAYHEIAAILSSIELREVVKYDV